MGGISSLRIMFGVCSFDGGLQKETHVFLGLGFNNVLQEHLLLAQLAYLANRT